MSDIAKRFSQNPILTPKDLLPSENKLQIISLLNPGVFTFDDKIWLIVRVAESIPPQDGYVSIPILDGSSKIQNTIIKSDDIDLIANDPRVVNYKGQDYLTTVSHFRLLYSNDGINFQETDEHNLLLGSGGFENYGIEDCRVSQIEDIYYLTYTAVSAKGVAIGLRTTKDWKIFDKKGLILPPHNKDCAIFETKINNKFYALHRPSSPEIGGNFIWIAESPDGIHWGNHKCILQTRKNCWDSARVGAGAAPIKTEIGWLEIYHGANDEHQYCLGAFLMDSLDPSKVLARTKDPIMIPTEKYELTGFFGNVVFTNGHIVNGDILTIYYGASDEVVCAAQFSIAQILASLHFTESN